MCTKFLISTLDSTHFLIISTLDSTHFFLIVVYTVNDISLKLTGSLLAKVERLYFDNHFLFAEVDQPVVRLR